MTRLNAIDPQTAQGKTKQLFDSVQKKLGQIPNIIKTIANSPAAVEAYLGFSGALSSGKLAPKLREQIALVVAETNGCEYCLAAHSAIGKSLGLSALEISDARSGESPDSQIDTALSFAKQIVERRGYIDNEELKNVRTAGYSDEEITEIIANVALNIFTNYFNHIAQTEVDFPRVEKLQKHAC